MHLKNPTGHKNIHIETDGIHQIFLEDFEEGSREFTLEIDISADHAECYIKGRAKSQGNDKKSWKISQKFLGKSQTGTLDLKGAAEGHSTLIFDGSGILEKSSTDAQVEIAEKIILSDEATARALPILTVKTDQVKSASHASTISCIPEDLVLYFQSRGIHKKTAENLIKEGLLK